MTAEQYKYQAGAEIRNYTLVEPLGRGGFSEVWKARDREHRRERFVALKLFDPRMMGDPSVAERADNEAHAQAKLEKSPLIVTVLHVQLTEPPHFIAMMLMSGGTLASRLRKEVPMPVREAIPLFRQIILALKVVHDEGLVHRDLKPSNILFERHAIRAATAEGPTGSTDHGPLRLSDFGIVHSPESDLTRYGYQLGTPAYMPPEQSVPSKGEKVTRATDIYAAGVILYEMLTGFRPIEGSSTTEVEVNRTLGNLTPINARAEVPKPLERLVMKCLASKAQYRYQSCDDLLQAFDAAVSEITGRVPSPAALPQLAERQELVPAPPAFFSSFTDSEPPVEGVASNYAKYGIALAGLLLLAGAGYYFLSGDRSASASPNREAAGTASKVAAPMQVEPAECAARDWLKARYDDPMLNKCTSVGWKQRASYVANLKSAPNWATVQANDVRLMDCAGWPPCELRIGELSRQQAVARTAAAAPTPVAQQPNANLTKPAAAVKSCSYQQAESLMDNGGLYEDCSQASDPAFCESCWKALKMPRGVGPGPK